MTMTGSIDWSNPAAPSLSPTITPPASARSTTASREGDDAMAALTDHYHRHSLSPRSYPQGEQDRRFIELVEYARVQGVIFFHDEWDDVLGWDYPDQKKLLDTRGIPSVFLKKQSYRAPDRAAQRDAVLNLVRSL